MAKGDVEVEAAVAAEDGAARRDYVRRIFSEIAPRYDLLNRVLSFGVDRRWRRDAVAALEWRGRPAGTYLDLCAGTLDVAAALAHEPGFRGVVVGADFAEPMLRAGVGKAPTGRMLPLAADAQRLPLRDASADGAVVAFGIRNVADLDATLQEARRVLRPASRLVVLEFSTPRSPVVRRGYHAYFHHVLPTVGRLVSGHDSAYRYLPRSVASFATPEELARRMTQAGFAAVRWRPLTFGVASLHVGVR